MILLLAVSYGSVSRSSYKLQEDLDRQRQMQAKGIAELLREESVWWLKKTVAQTELAEMLVRWVVNSSTITQCGV